MLWAAWTGLHRFHAHGDVGRAALMTPPSPPVSPSIVSSPVVPPAVVAPTPAVGTSKASSVASLPTVLHQEIPDVSRSARESIHGVIKIVVRVMVDRSGNVAAAALDSRASSKYLPALQWIPQKNGSSRRPWTRLRERGCCTSSSPARALVRTPLRCGPLRIESATRSFSPARADQNVRVSSATQRARSRESAIRSARRT